MFFKNNGMKLEINKRNKFGKYTNVCKFLKNTLINNQGLKKKSQ